MCVRFGGRKGGAVHVLAVVAGKHCGCARVGRGRCRVGLGRRTHDEVEAIAVMQGDPVAET